MRKIKNVVFDFGGVLLQLDQNKSFDALGQIIQVDFDVNNLPPDWSDHFHNYEMGLMGDESFLWKFQQLTKGKATPQQIIKAWNAMLLEIRPEVLQFLTDVKKRYNTYLLSNTNEMHMRYVRYQILERQHKVLDWNQFFHQTYYSHQLKMRKPNLDIYQKVNQLGGFEKEATLFIDDNPQNVETAKKFGWNAVLHPSNAKIEQYFETYIDRCENV